LVAKVRDVDPQVARDGDQRDLPFARSQQGNDHGVGAERTTRAPVGADQQEVDRFLVVQRRDGRQLQVRIHSGQGSQIGQYGDARV
jgi:hypothetical protein